VGQSLFYGTGGLAFGRVNDTFLNDINVAGSFGSFSATADRMGWTAGAGWEYALAPNWTVKVEYLHVDLGSTSLDISAANTNTVRMTGVIPPPGSAVLHFNNSFDLVRVGVGYRW
jgi:outer membrane immunogenic protein